MQVATLSLVPAPQQQSTATVFAITTPAAYVVMDIETGDAPEEAIQAALTSWKAPANMKDPEKIAVRRDDAKERIRERSALLDAAPIICVGIQTQNGSAEFNGMDLVAYPVGGVPSIACGNEKAMLVALRKWLDARVTPDTVIVGQNVKGFDLPKLRNAYIRHRLQLPAIFAPRVLGSEPPVVDTVSLFRSFSVEHRDDFCPSLDSVCAGLGIPKPKSVVSGADVPRMHREGRFHEILTYNAIDREATTRAYLLMTGQAEDLQ